ncbi:MAG: TIGR00725 family protein [Gemmatimonadota bacterium]|jgi:uncharacterized protein (TIGR00725 family)
MGEEPRRRPLRIAVVGAAAAAPGDYEDARALGAALAEAGAVVLCGGHGGVMEGVARGAAEAGGLVVGLLRGEDSESANSWITLPLATGLGDARNALIVRAAEAVVAVGGSWGTLSEIALASKMGLAVGTLGRPPATGLGLPALSDPADAARWALDRARERRGETSRAGSGTYRREE